MRVERLPHAADLPLPAYATPGAAGLDLLAAVPAEGLTLAPGAIVLVPTGLKIALPPGTEAQVRPRSGLALRHGVTVLNSPGTIDSDYRGEVGVVLVNHGSAAFAIQRGRPDRPARSGPGLALALGGGGRSTPRRAVRGASARPVLAGRGEERC